MFLCPERIKPIYKTFGTAAMNQIGCPDSSDNAIGEHCVGHFPKSPEVGSIGVVDM